LRAKESTRNVSGELLDSYEQQLRMGLDESETLPAIAANLTAQQRPVY
jgi:hypothetical protein